MSQLPDEAFEQLVQGYFDETLDDAQSRELMGLLRADDRCMKRFAEVASLQQMIASEVGYHSQAKRFNLSLSSSDSGAASAMAELARLYEDAPQLPEDFATWRWKQAHQAKAERQRVLRNRLLIGVGSIAAVLALVSVLTLVFGSGPAATTPNQTAAQNDPQAPEAPSAPRVVATLTGMQDAVWEDGAGGLTRYTVGRSLQAGDRLTLVSGFATLTTNHGALAELEGPCTVALVDHDNALRLHSGRLIGRVDSERAKGFIVRTPQMDVIDLGTEFGVVVDRDGRMLAEVFEGSVRVQAAAGAPQTFAPTVMSAGQSLAVDTNSQRIEPSAFASDVFTNLITGNDGFAQLAGNARWVSASAYIGRKRLHWPTHDAVQVFEELRRVEAPSAFPVSFHRPGFYRHYGPDAERTSIQPGTVIRSYLVVYNTGPDAKPTADNATGTLKFAGKIVGVIDNGEHHQAFIEAMAATETRVWDGDWSFHGANIRTKQNFDHDPDWVRIDRSGREMSFSFVTDPNVMNNAGFRALRVLIQETEE